MAEAWCSPRILPVLENNNTRPTFLGILWMACRSAMFPHPARASPLPWFLVHVQAATVSDSSLWHVGTGGDTPDLARRVSTPRGACLLLITRARRGGPPAGTAGFFTESSLAPDNGVTGLRRYGITGLSHVPPTILENGHVSVGSFVRRLSLMMAGTPDLAARAGYHLTS
ncbi:hypothetical protein LZ30DRAFT_403932 [Colletotrichum cereale]|nr:hypothetical protein LZ30DRAFT_403932 [Colletotrichum cereale]